MRGFVGWIELFAGMGGDGSESVRGRVGIIIIIIIIAMTMFMVLSS